MWSKQRCEAYTKILKSETTSSPGSSCFPIWRRHIGKREDEPVLSLARFWCSRDRVRPLLSMRGMLLRYSLEPRPYRRVPATAGLVMIVGLAINGCLHWKKTFWREREQDWLLQNFGLRRSQRFDMIPTEPPPFLLFTRREILIVHGVFHWLLSINTTVLVV